MKKIDISGFDPCDDGRDYYASCSSFEEAWEKCPRGDWMLWMAFKLGVDKRTLTLAKGLCANTVRHLMKDDRSVKAVDAAIAFGRGEIDEEELEAAAADARAAARYAARDAAWYAARAAARYAADAAWYAAAAARYAADAATYAADAYAADAAGTTNRKLTANICREVLTDKVLEKINPEV